MSLLPYDLLKLTQDFGEALTLRKRAFGAYDPDLGGPSSSAYTDYSFTGYFYTYNVTSVDEIRRGTRKCIIPALGLGTTPDDEDEILGNGDTVHITRIVTMFNNGTPICHLCDVSE